MNSGYLWKVALPGFSDQCGVGIKREESRMIPGWIWWIEWRNDGRIELDGREVEVKVRVCFCICLKAC